MTACSKRSKAASSVHSQLPQRTQPKSKLHPLLNDRRTLLRHQRNRRTYNCTGLGIEFLHYPSTISIGVRIRQRPPVQLFQPLSHLNSVLFTSIAGFTIWTVESQQGQQVASQIHDEPRGIQFIRLRACCTSSGGTAFRRGVTYYGTRSGCRFNKIGLTSRSLTSPQPANVLSSHFSPGAPLQVGQRTANTCFGLSSFVL